jgi:ribosomal protection tetracycline resistance protein
VRQHTHRLNLGIVAHVDAGKTTLTERLLYETGVSTHLGRVDHGDTVTDADDIERRRGITIRSAVVAFTVDDLKVNLIDTPGHADFVAEVERALAVLDGAVLVVSAVEGIQAQTRALIRIMERLGIPFMVFVNKIDRSGASVEGTLAALREALAGDAIALNEPQGMGSRSASVAGRGGADFADELADRLSVVDESVLAAYVDGSPPDVPSLLASLARATAGGRMHPVVLGAALTGVGVPDVLAAVAAYLPASGGSSEDTLHATVFKIERDPGGHPLAYVRMRAGTLTSRDDVVRHHRSPGGTITAVPERAQRVATYAAGAATTEATAVAGDIATVVGLPDAEIGDQLGRWDPAYGLRLFPPPGLESVVVARDPADRARLFEAVQRLSAQDPLIDARLDGADHELTVSLYGEVQREVLTARLAEEFGIAADVLESRTVHVERVAGVGEWALAVRTGNASVAYRVEPGPPGSGERYVMGTERGYILPAHHRAIEEAVPRVMASGLLGWRVVDWVVTLTNARFQAPTPPAGYFRDLTERALRRALREAGTCECEPVSAFEVEVPEESFTAVLHVLIAAGATPDLPVFAGGRCTVTGRIPTRSVHGVERALPELTGGRGFLVSEPAGYERI